MLRMLRAERVEAIPIGAVTTRVGPCASRSRGGRRAWITWITSVGERVPTIVTLRKIVGSIAVPIPCASKLQSNPSTESDEGR
eukprot:1709979-Pyramimonas_sp.AAC.1